MDTRRAEELVERYSDTLLRIGYTWFSNLPDAQDACQTALVRLLEDGRSFPDAGQERAWVIRVGVNVCKNMKRSAWRRRTVALEEGMELAVPPPGEEDSLLPLVQALPLKYRQVIYLRYYEEYRVEEIARLLGIKPALVSTRLGRARARLKRMLEDTGYENRIPD